jgi:hypothetical protein
MVRWLQRIVWWCRPRRSSADNGSPHSGHVVNRASETTGALVNHHGGGSVEADLLPSTWTPHSGARATVGVLFFAHVNPQCGNQELARAQLTLAALSEGWWRAAQHKWSPRYCCAQEAAHEFWRCLRTQQSLEGLRLPSQWIENQYPIFCKAGGLTKAPPFKDFARELKRIMPKSRPETRRDGRRRAITTYTIVPFREAMSHVQAVREAA